MSDFWRVCAHSEVNVSTHEINIVGSCISLFKEMSEIISQYFGETKMDIEEQSTEWAFRKVKMQI